MTVLILAIVITLVVAIIAAIAIGSDEGPFEAFMAFSAVAAVVGAILILPAYSWSYSHYNQRTIACTVKDKDRAGDSGNMRIYTNECGVLVNKDSWFRGKTTSADVWSEIEPGKRYTFTVVGWRLGITSDFPNILEVESDNRGQ